MKTIVFSALELADLFQKQLYQRGVLGGKWPNQWTDYNRIYPMQGTSNYFVPINASDFDLLTPEELEQLAEIDDNWYTKPNL